MKEIYNETNCFGKLFDNISNYPIPIKILNKNAKTPTKGSERAAGHDLYAAIEEPVEIRPHETEKISTGLSMALPPDTFGAIFARSGLATKKGLRPANDVGVIDEDYRGELKIPIHNNGDNYQEIIPGERIAQLVVQPYTPVSILERKELSKTKRGNNGFGSTGRK